MNIYEDYPYDKNLPKTYNPLKEEDSILRLWTKKKLFARIKENREKSNDGRFSVHWGPPFPTGSPHCGQILNAVLKDSITRHYYQKNLQVDTKFGWDCHGLSVEHQVDKKLGIKRLEAIEAIGTTAYNEQCRQFVQQNQGEWKKIFDRFGIWVDFTNTYSTMDVSYMESVWAVFKQLYDTGLVYRDTKVLPHSTACFSHLSNFEAEQNWRETSEKEIIISVDLVGSNEKLLISTTEPWTLVDNMTICVNPSSEYVKVNLVERDFVYILSKEQLTHVLSQQYDITDEVQGSYLLQFRYRPLLPYNSHNVHSLPIIGSEFKFNDVGTGLVALSPYFKEDHYRACKEFTSKLPEDACPIDESGRFKAAISELVGLSIYEANDVIIEYLEKHKRILQQKDFKLKKPHCWRSDVPLIHRIASSWFIPVNKLSPKLAEKKSQLNWIHGEPNGDLSRLIEKTTDWPISRRKYWGTPIPIWSSDLGDEIRCIGSIEELLLLSGKDNISDLHREHLDHIEIPSSVPGNPPLRRVFDVFDCWFESALTPFISNRPQADLIIEGHDQTCGWLYTILVMSAVLDKPLPSNNILAHGLVLSTDGLKLSKRKHNKNDPEQMVDMYGADAVRVALMSSPLPTLENHLFTSSEVRHLNSELFSPLYQIIYDMMLGFGKKGWIFYGYLTHPKYISNIFDLWIFSQAEAALQFFYSELKAYRMNNIVPRIVALIKDVSFWYIPNRTVRNGKGWCHPAHILYNIVFRICVMLSPFAPFFTEMVFQHLAPYTYLVTESFHERVIPDDGSLLIQHDVDTKIDRWRTVIELVGLLRSEHIIPLQYRISELFVFHPLAGFLDENEDLEKLLKKYTNYHRLTNSQDWSLFGASLKALLRKHSSLELSLNSTKLDEVDIAISKLSQEELKEVVRIQSLELLEHTIPLNCLEFIYEFKGEMDKNVAIMTKGALLVVIKMNKELSYYEEGARVELIRTIEKARRKAKVYSSEHITINYTSSDECLRNAFRKFSNEIENCTKSRFKIECLPADDEGLIFKEEIDIKGARGVLHLFRKL